jgi:hypothetical protein
VTASDRTVARGRANRRSSSEESTSSQKRVSQIEISLSLTLIPDDDDDDDFISHLSFNRIWRERIFVPPTMLFRFSDILSPF